MTTFTEIFIDQGTTFTHNVNVIDAVTNDYINIAGYSVSSQFRASYDSANATGTFICNVIDAANGGYNMTMTAANTSNIDSGQYVFDVKATSPANVVSRILEGIVIVTPQVTR